VAFRTNSGRNARRFLCAASTWDFLRDLGQTFGWRPRGTTYVTSSRQTTRPSAHIRHNYQAGGEQDCKQISSDDAVEWANALGIAKDSSHFDGMMRAHAGLIDSSMEPLLKVVDEFIAFAREGAFVFAISETSEAQRDSNELQETKA
jgi:hypothetical protein